MPVSIYQGYNLFKVPIYLAAGTAAQQLDATFSTTSTLELYSLNLSETGHDMPIAARYII